MKINRRNAIIFLLLSSAFLAGSGCRKKEEEHTTPPVASNHAEVQSSNTAEPKAPEEVLSVVESLVAPIALYPDPVLAEVLIAATYPAEIGQAARRLEVGPVQDSSNGKDWDASLVRLAHLPSVIIMLNEHPQWTVALGDAFLATPETLLQAVQTLRHKAMKSGFLKDSAAQKVVLKTIPAGTQNSAPALPANRDIIIILPVGAEKIHVPLYDPQTVFSAALAAPSENATNNVIEQPAVLDDTNTGTRNAYYPANYPVDSIARESGGSYLAFGAGTVIPGLQTWGNIEWSGKGYAVTHPYGNLSNCADAEDCWIRSVDQGYYYTSASALLQKSLQNGVKETPASANHTAFGVPWHHDPRHRRAIRYSVSVLRQLGEIGPPPLAGQRLSGIPMPLTERGFAAPLVMDDAETDTDTETSSSYPISAAYSVFSGINATDAGDSEALKRGKASRYRNKVAATENTTDRDTDSRRNLRKPSLKQAVLPEALQLLYIEQQRRETALPSVFEIDLDTIRLIARFSRRGTESRANHVSSANTAKTPLFQMPEEGD